MVQRLLVHWIPLVMMVGIAMEDEDADGAVELYEAVKQIGNPDAVGNHYRMTWNEIIQAGFRTVQDFVAHGITNLEQLQQYIDKSHNK